MRAILVGVVIVGAAAAARTAAAQCRGGLSTVSPESGAILPPDPTIFVFFDKFREPRVIASQDGELLAVDQEIVDSREAWTVVRARVHTRHAGPIHVAAEGEHWEYGDATYMIADGVARDDAALVAADLEDDHWSCSYTHAVKLDVTGDAVAYRLEWSTDPDTLRHGAPDRAYLLPRLPYGIDRPLRGGVHELEIGHLSCRGWDVDDGAFAVGVYVRLVAIFADGRERGAYLGPMQIDHRTLRAPDWWTAPAELSLAPKATPPPREEPAPPAQLEPLWPALATAAGGGAAAAAIMVLWLGRPRRRTRATLGDL